MLHTIVRYAHIAVETDWIIGCWTRDVARVATGPNKVWRYFFTHRYENDAFLNTLRAFHTGEMPFVFGNLSQIYYTDVAYSPSTDEVALSNEMMGYWTRFATTGDPNGESAPQWPAYDASLDNTFQLDVATGTINGYHNDKCDFLDSLPVTPVAAQAADSLRAVRTGYVWFVPIAL